MEIIKWNDIDFSVLKKTKVQGTKSTVYEKGDICVKILNELSVEEKKALYKKLHDMDGMKIEGMILPIDLIIKDGNLEGYTMEYFKDSMNLFDYLCSTRYIDCKDILTLLKRASLILKDIHDNEIIYQDLSLDNILINKSGDIMFSDVDGCRYKEHSSPFVSKLFKRLMIDYRKESINICQNMDKISMLISMFYILYLKEIQFLSKRRYHSLSSYIKTLKNSEKYASNLTDRKSTILEIPYLDELIEDSDSYIIDRHKQLSLRGKILKR